MSRCIFKLLLLVPCASALLTSEAGSAGTETIHLLKFPYPYRAAVSVNSDIDGATVEKFNAVHELVNTTNRIAPQSDHWNILFDKNVQDRLLSQDGILGFGLPLADSMWLYDDGIGLYKSYDYSAGRPVPNRFGNRDMREILDEWLRKGWIDTLHSPGAGDIRREATRAGLLWLQEAPHRQLKVWVNHSSTVTPANIGAGTVRALPLLVKNTVKAVPVGLRAIGASRLADAVPIPRPYRFPEEQRALCWAAAIWLYIAGFLVIVVLTVRRMRRPTFLFASSATLLLTFAVLYHMPVRYHFGHIVNSPYYCADLARESGFTYYWLISDVPGCKAHIPNALALPEGNVKGRPTILRLCRLDDGATILI